MTSWYLGEHITLIGIMCIWSRAVVIKDGDSGVFCRKVRAEAEGEGGQDIHVKQYKEEGRHYGKPSGGQSKKISEGKR